MPRSPAEGAATRAAAELEVNLAKPSRDRRVRSGTDRRHRDVGPPHGIERRRFDRRSHDRRTVTRRDRRLSSRRALSDRRALAKATSMRNQNLLPKHFEAPPHQQMPRLLRAIIITAVALACLLAATLTANVDRAGAAAKSTPGSLRVHSGAYTATVTYERRMAYGKTRIYSKLRLTVRGGGRTALKNVKLRGAASESWLTRPGLRLTDVTADGIPDPVIETYTGGAHCCGVSAVAPSTTAGWDRPVVRNWADYGFKLEELGGTDQPEFVGRDPRFIGAYTSFAASRSPIQIFHFVNGSYVDVTRDFPDVIRADATDLGQQWTDAGKQSPSFQGENGRGALAAWVADLALIGDTAGAQAAVKGASDRGDFKTDRSSFLTTAFPGQLGHDLLTWGYTTDPTTLGLTNAPAPAENSAARLGPVA